MNTERMTLLARNAAVAMMDRNLTFEEKGKITNPPEIDALPQEEYRAFQYMMTTFMREIIQGENKE